MIDTPGIYRMPAKEYHADPCKFPSLSRGVLHTLLSRTPYHAWYSHPRLNPGYKPTEDSKYDIGKAAHALFLEGADVAVVVDADDWRTKESKAQRNAAWAEGKTPLLRGQYDDVQRMVEVANQRFEEVTGYEVAEGDSEMSCFWLDEDETWIRIRPDWMPKADRGTLIVDYKTTAGSAGPMEFSRIVAGNGYDVQDAIYRRGIRALCNDKPDFLFMVQETAPPYLCTFHYLDMMYQDMGEDKVNRGIARWKECLRTKQWPAYPSEPYTVEPPGWALASWEMAKLQGATL